MTWHNILDTQHSMQRSWVGQVSREKGRRGLRKNFGSVTCMGASERLKPWLVCVYVCVTEINQLI